MNRMRDFAAAAPPFDAAFLHDPYPVYRQLREAGPAELAVVLYRRMMMRVADLVADRAKATCLVTGTW